MACCILGNIIKRKEFQRTLSKYPCSHGSVEIETTTKDTSKSGDSFVGNENLIQ